MTHAFEIWATSSKTTLPLCRPHFYFSPKCPAKHAVSSPVSLECHWKMRGKVMKLAATVYNQLAKNLASFVVCRVAFKPAATRCRLRVYSSLCGKLIAQYCIFKQSLGFYFEQTFFKLVLKKIWKRKAQRIRQNSSMLFPKTEVICAHHTSGGGYVSYIAKSHVPKSE